MLLEIKKEKIEISEVILKKIDWITNYTKYKPIIVNGNLIKLIPTNLAYVEPHKIYFKNMLCLFFNGQDYFYIDNLSKKYKMSELEPLIKEKSL
jgi:hypothetical protein